MQNRYETHSRRQLGAANDKGGKSMFHQIAEGVFGVLYVMSKKVRSAAVLSANVNHTRVLVRTNHHTSNMMMEVKKFKA